VEGEQTSTGILNPVEGPRVTFGLVRGCIEEKEDIEKDYRPYWGFEGAKPYQWEIMEN